MSIPPAQLKAAAAVAGKRDKVCELVRAAVEARQGEDGKYQKCVVQSMISMTVPAIDEALEFIRVIREGVAPVGGTVRADILLKYAAVIVADVNKLYSAALGTYDLDLVIMVAQVAHGARFSAEIYTRGCHWIPRMFASSEHACDQWHSSRMFTHLTG